MELDGECILVWQNSRYFCCVEGLSSQAMGIYIYVYICVETILAQVDHISDTANALCIVHAAPCI